MADRTKYAKVYTDLTDHPVWMDLDPAHVGLWVLSLIYCSRNLTDGHFPAKGATRWGGDDVTVDGLVEAGRWHRPGHDCGACPQPEPGSLYVHDYLQHQRSKEDAEALSAKRAEAGKRGRAKQVAGKLPSKSRAETETETNTETDNPARATAPAAFDAFWSLYPRKIGKAAAAKAHAKAIKSTDADTILTGLRNSMQVWQSSRTEDKFIPHAATWLNRESWADEIPLPGAPTLLPPPPSGDLYGNFGSVR